VAGDQCEVCGLGKQDDDAVLTEEEMIIRDQIMEMALKESREQQAREQEAREQKALRAEAEEKQRKEREANEAEVEVEAKRNAISKQTHSASSLPSGLVPSHYSSRVCCCVTSCACRVVSCRVVSCRVVSCRVVSCRVVSSSCLHVVVLIVAWVRHRETRSDRGQARGRACPRRGSGRALPLDLPGMREAQPPRRGLLHRLRVRPIPVVRLRSAQPSPA